MRNKVIHFTLIISALFSCGTGIAFELGGVEIHGFISQGYLITDENNYLADTEDGSFQFNEMGINFSTDLTEKIRAGLQLFARDLGPEGNDNIMLDWAFAGYRWQDWFGIRFGKVKVVHGLYNEIREMDMLRTSIMMPESVYQELWRDAFTTVKGIDIYGDIYFAAVGTISYEAQVGTLPFKEDGGLARAFESNLSAFNLDVTEMDSEYAYLGALTWSTPLKGLRTRCTGFKVDGTKLQGNMTIPALFSPTKAPLNTRMDYEVFKHKGFVLSAEYTWQDLVIASEYFEGKFSGKWDWNLGQGYQNRPPLDNQGWYVSASYRFIDKFEVGAGYSEFYPNANDKKGKTKANDFEAWLNTISLCFRYDVNENWIIKIEGQHNDGFGGYTPTKNPDGLERKWYLFAAKLSVLF